MIDMKVGDKMTKLRSLSVIIAAIFIVPLFTGCYVSGGNYPLVMNNVYIPDPQRSAFVKAASELEYEENEVALFAKDKITYPELQKAEISIPCRDKKNGVMVQVAYYMDDDKLVLANATTYDGFKSLIVDGTRAALWIDDLCFIVYDFKTKAMSEVYASDSTRDGTAQISLKKITSDGKTFAYTVTDDNATKMFISDVSFDTSKAIVREFTNREFIGFTPDNTGYFFADVYQDHGIQYVSKINWCSLDGTNETAVYDVPLTKQVIGYVNSRTVYTTGLDTLTIIDLTTGEESQYSIGSFSNVFQVSMSQDGKYASFVFHRLDENGVAYLNLSTLNLETGNIKNHFDQRVEDELQLASCSFFTDNLLLISYITNNADKPYISKLFKISH